MNMKKLLTAAAIISALLVVSACSSKAIEEGEYVNGEKHGHWVEPRDSGVAVEEGEYVNGKKHGDWLIRWNDGDVWKYPYKNGDLQHGDIDRDYAEEEGKDEKKSNWWAVGILAAAGLAAIDAGADVGEVSDIIQPGIEAAFGQEPTQTAGDFPWDPTGNLPNPTQTAGNSPSDEHPTCVKAGNRIKPFLEQIKSDDQARLDKHDSDRSLGNTISGVQTYCSIIKEMTLLIWGTKQCIPTYTRDIDRNNARAVIKESEERKASAEESIRRISTDNTPSCNSIPPDVSWAE